MTTIPRQEISPDRPNEIPTLAGIEVQLKNLRDQTAEKGQTIERKKSELESIRKRFASLESTKGLDTGRAENVRASLAALAQELESGKPQNRVNNQIVLPKTESTLLGIDTKTATQVGTALAVVGIGTGIVVGWRAMKAWMKKEKDIVKEKVQTGMTWLKWISLATAGGLLTFFGLRALQDRLLKGSLEKVEAEIKKKGEQAVGAIVASGKDGVASVQEATKNLAGDAAAAVAGAGTAAASKAEDLKKKIAPEAKEVAEELKTMSKEEVTARIVIAQHTKDWNLDDVAKKNQIIGLINNNAGRSMDDIDQRRDAGSALPLDIPDATTDRENREQSVNALLDYCDTHRPEVIEMVKHEKKCDDAEAEKYVGTMPLSAYLDHALRSNNAFVRAASELEKGAGSFAQLMETLKNLNFAYILKGDQYVEKEFHAMMSEARQADFGLSDEEINDIDFIDLLQSALSSSKGTVLNAYNSLEGATTPSDKVLKFIYSKIIDESNTTHKVLLPLFYDVFPTEETGKTPEQIVRTYLLERMTPAEALRFYMYHRILSQGNAVVLPLMQVEVIRFIARHDKGPLQGVRKYTAMTRMGGSLVSNGGGKIVEEWKKLNVNLNIELTEDEEKMIGYLGKMILASPFQGILEHAKAVGGMLSGYPGKAALLFTGAAAGKVLWTRQSAMLTGVDLPAFKQIIDALPDVKGQTGAAVKMTGALRKIFSTFLATHDELIEVKSAWKTIFTEAIDKFHDPKVTTQASKLFRACINQPRSSNNWASLAKELFDIAGKTGSNELLEAAQKAEAMSLPNAARIRRVFGAMAVGFRTSWKSAVLSAGVQPLFSATTVAIDRGIAKGIDVTKDAAAALKNSKFLPKILAKSGVALDAFMDAVRDANIPTHIAELFAKSKGGMHMLVNAFKLSGIPGINYLTKLSALIPPATILTGPLGAVGLDAFFIMAERSALNGEIANTDSVALKEFYEERKKLTSAAAIPTAAFLGLGFAPGLIVGGAYAGTRKVQKYFDSATIDWLKNDKDMQKLPAGELLSKLKEIAPGQQRYKDQTRGGILEDSVLSQGLTLNSGGQERFEAVEQTNNGQRGKLTTAYLSAMSVVSPLPDETEAQYKERFARFQTEQNKFIARVSGGSFASQSPETYRKAHAHAEVSAICAQLKTAQESQFMPLTHDDGSGHFVVDDEFDLVEYEDLPPFGTPNADGVSRDDVLASWIRHQDAISMMPSAQRATTIRTRLLKNLRYDLSSLDAKLAIADLAGWSMTGGEEETRETIRRFVHEQFLQKLTEESVTLAAQTDAGLDDLARSMARLRGFLGQDPAVLEELASAQPVSPTVESTLEWRALEAESRLAA